MKREDHTRREDDSHNGNGAESSNKAAMLPWRDELKHQTHGGSEKLARTARTFMDCERMATA